MSNALPDVDTRIEIFEPESPADWQATRAIVSEYGASLGIDLSFQDFEAELRNLPGDYAPPRGLLLLASVGGAVAACCALRPLDSADIANACEMKRLYVRPAYRRLGLGRRLAEAVMDEARMAGYDHVLLDTLDDMEAARTLYVDLGFVEIPPYYHNPIPGAHYLRASLTESRF